MSYNLKSSCEIYPAPGDVLQWRRTCAGLGCGPDWGPSASPVLMGGRSVFLLRGNEGDVRRSVAVGLWGGTRVWRQIFRIIPIIS